MSTMILAVNIIGNTNFRGSVAGIAGLQQVTDAFSNNSDNA